MRLSVPATRIARRLLPLLVVSLLLALLTGPAAVQAAETTTSTTAAVSSSTTTTVSAEGVQPGQTAIVPPAAVQVPLNPGWKTDQMDVRVMPEYDQKAVLVIVGFSLPADVPLPATLKFPIPAGAKITGIGEVDPNGNFTYNYTTSYPPVEPGTDWDIATIEVKNYRQLQIDYYYDPGLPQGAGQRSFPLLTQMPLDVGQLLLHVQQPARATDFKIDPALQGSGTADDGFTYWVGAYPEVKAGSTLGHLVSYNNPDGGLSTDSGESGSTQVSTNTVLLAAILIIVICIGGLVIYRLFFRSSKPDPKKGSPKPQGAKTVTPSSGAAKQRGPGATSPKGSTTKAAPPKATATTKAAVAAEPAATPEAATTTDPATKRDAEVPESCVACGEELTTDSPFCPNCGEARP